MAGRSRRRSIQACCISKRFIPILSEQTIVCGGETIAAADYPFVHMFYKCGKSLQNGGGEKMQDYILEVKDLCKYYPGVKALDGVSVGFKEGEIHALAGENGAGKSTLIKMLTGAIEPTRGEIVLRGESYPKPVSYTHLQAQKRSP